MDSLIPRYLLLWFFVLHIVNSYPRKSPADVHIHPKARANPKSKLLAYFHLDSDHFILKRDVKEYRDKMLVQPALQIFFKQFGVKFASENIFQYGTWYPKYVNYKTEQEKIPRHTRKRRSIRNSVSPSSDGQHLTTVNVNAEHESDLGREIQDEITIEHNNQNETNVETDYFLNTDPPNPTQISVTIPRYNQNLVNSEQLDNHQPTESMNQNEPFTPLHNGINDETHLHQHYSDLRHDNEEATDQYIDNRNNENLNPADVTNNDHHEPNFQNDTDQTVDLENDDINNMLPNPTLNMNNEPQGRNFGNDNQYPSDSRNGNEEVSDQENDNIENPTIHTNPGTNRNRHRGETPDDEDTHLDAGVHQQSRVADGHHLDTPLNNGGLIEGGVSPDSTSEVESQSHVDQNEGAREPEHGQTSVNSITNEEDTMMRITRNVGHAQNGDTSHTNGQENPVVNDPGTDGIPSANSGNRNIPNNNNEHPASIENADEDGTDHLDRPSNTSLIIDHNVPSVNHPADGSKINQTSDNLNSTVQALATVKADTNQTIEINPTRAIGTNMTTSTRLHSTQQPSENSTSSPSLTPLSLSQQTSVSMSPVSSGSDGNFTTIEISSSISGQENNTTIVGSTGDTMPSTIDSDDEIKTTIKMSTEHRAMSTETLTNTTEVTAEPATPSDNRSSVWPAPSHTEPPIPSPNASGHDTSLTPRQITPLTGPHQTVSNSTSTTSTTFSMATHSMTTSSASTTSSSSTLSLTSDTNVELNTREYIPPTVNLTSLVNGLPATIFTLPTTKLEDSSTLTTAGGPKDESTSPTPAMSSSEGNTPSTTDKDRPIHKPQCFMELHLSMSWFDFCTQELSIRGELVELLQQEGGREEVTIDQVQVLNRKEEECRAVALVPDEHIQVQVYLVNKTHHFDRDLTLVCARLLSSKFRAGDTSLIQEKLLAVHLYDEFQTSPRTKHNSNSKSDDSSGSFLNDPGVTIALVIAVVGSCCGVGLIILQTKIRRRHRNGSRTNNNSGSSNIHNVVSNNNRSFSITSADSIQLYTVSKSAGGVINFGLNLMEPLDPTHPLNLTQLSEFCADDHKIYYEYQKLPNRLPRLSVVPNGEEDKNRYANILPLAHTRVKLNKDDSRNSQSSYINANYVTGPNNECQYYIATQAPTTKTINDFWTMVWQQETKAIVMLTQLEEGGQCKAATYWPELTGKSAAHRHGDFVIELKQKDVNQEYISSRLEVNNLRKIETRQIQHFWYTCWPSHGTPEPISLVKFVLDTRPRFENSGKPLIVHCSPGTGRTGTFIGLDLCMRQFESRRIVDVMKTVHDLRLERAGAVQNKEQYALLYNAVNEYASIVASPVVSVASSASTLHALLPD